MHNLVKSIYGEYSVKYNIKIEDIYSICSKENTIVFIDANVQDNWDLFSGDNYIKLEANEDTKTLIGITNIINLLKENYKINSLTKYVVIGGGIIQDAVGFVLSILNRGVKYTLIPTTVLAQLDSCVGGKTSINHIDKNILGSFWPPNEILICTDFLMTLNSIDYWSGFGEYIKYNIIQNKIDESFLNLSSENIKRNEINLIKPSLSYKISIVNIDEFDKGLRKFLNFGHTFGHAIEKITNYEIPHGYAVYIGSLIALKVSQKQNGSDIYNINKLKEFTKFYFKVSGFDNIVNKFNGSFLSLDLIEIAIRSDKKQINDGGLRMILIKNGRPIIETIMDNDLLKQSIIEVRDEIII